MPCEEGQLEESSGKQALMRKRITESEKESGKPENCLLSLQLSEDTVRVTVHH